MQQSEIRSHLTSNYHHRRQRQLPKPAVLGGQSFVFPIEKTSRPQIVGAKSRDKKTSSAFGVFQQSTKLLRVETDDENRQHSDLEPWQKHGSASLVRPTLSLSFKGQEGRTFQFFQQRTALEFSGWCDAEFWNVLALQASHLHSALKHAIVSLGAFHLSLIVTDRDARDDSIKFSLEQGKRALAAMLKENSMSMSAILLTYTAIAANSAFLHWSRFWQVTHGQLQLFDELRARPSRVSPAEWMFISKYLAPVIERQRSKAGQYVDMLCCLRTTDASHFYVSDKPYIPLEFSSLRYARDLLETLLKWTTYVTKGLKLPELIIPKVAEDCFRLWHERLDQFGASHATTQQDQCNISVLRVAAKMGVMLIKTMHADKKDEMIFDNFTEVYLELVNVFKQALDYIESISAANMRFGIESGMLTLVGNTANRWCRNPTIRRDIIKLLYRAQRREAIEDGVVWARIIECTMQLEESGIVPPPQSAQDVPAEHRVRSLHVAFYHRANMQQMTYHLAPYEDSLSDIKEIMIPHVVGSSGQGNAIGTMPIEIGEKPEVILGRDYTSWLSSDGQEYLRIDHPNFYFPLPKV